MSRPGIVFLLVLLASCSRSEQTAPQPEATVQPSAVPTQFHRSVEKEPPQPTPVADLSFNGTALETCDELQVPAGRMGEWEAVAAKTKREPEEVVRVGQTCAQATSGKVEQATCVQGPLTTFHYQKPKTDKAMRECLQGGGQWARNTSREAARAALEQEVARLQRLADGEQGP